MPSLVYIRKRGEEVAKDLTTDEAGQLTVDHLAPVSITLKKLKRQQVTY